MPPSLPRWSQVRISPRVAPPAPFSGLLRRHALDQVERMVGALVEATRQEAGRGTGSDPGPHSSGTRGIQSGSITRHVPSHSIALDAPGRSNSE